MSTPILYITCAFPRRGVSTVVELLTDQAPVTCKALWQQLPIVADTYHSKWGGQQVFLVLPSLQGLSLENPTSALAKGDLVLFQHGLGYRGAPRHLRALGLADYGELAICYGPRVRAFGPSGEVRGTRVGRIVEGLDHFARAVQDMRRTGFETMRVEAR